MSIVSLLETHLAYAAGPPTASTSAPPRASCAAPWASPLLAVLGILSYSGDEVFRTALRETALVAPPVEILPCFVVRGRGLTRAMLKEQQAHNDLILVDADERLSRAVGPLVAIRLWFARALADYPEARFIGKADSDAFYDLERVAAQLRLLEPPVRDGGDDRQGWWYWGHMESYHAYSPTTGALGAFGYNPAPPLPCARQLLKSDGMSNATDAFGPFPFAKGPLFFLERPLVAAINESAELRAEADALVAERPLYEADARRNGYRQLHPLWEDIWVGYALARVAPTAPGGRVAFRTANIGRGLYWEEGYRRKPGELTVLWHLRYKHRRWAKSQRATFRSFALAHNDSRVPGLWCKPVNPALATCALASGGIEAASAWVADLDALVPDIKKKRSYTIGGAYIPAEWHKTTAHQHFSSRNEHNETAATYGTYAAGAGATGGADEPHPGSGRGTGHGKDAGPRALFRFCEFIASTKAVRPS